MVQVGAGVSRGPVQKVEQPTSEGSVQWRGSHEGFGKVQRGKGESNGSEEAETDSSRGSQSVLMSRGADRSQVQAGRMSSGVRRSSEEEQRVGAK